MKREASRATEKKAKMALFLGAFCTSVVVAASCTTSDKAERARQTNLGNKIKIYATEKFGSTF